MVGQLPFNSVTPGLELWQVSRVFDRRAFSTKWLDQLNAHSELGHTVQLSPLNLSLKTCSLPTEENHFHNDNMLQQCQTQAHSRSWFLWPSRIWFYVGYSAKCLCWPHISLCHVHSLSLSLPPLPPTLSLIFWQVWLIEVNVNPALHTNCTVLSIICPAVVQETLGKLWTETSSIHFCSLICSVYCSYSNWGSEQVSEKQITNTHFCAKTFSYYFSEAIVIIISCVT